jgi:hypothetical protein
MNNAGGEINAAVLISTEFFSGQGLTLMRRELENWHASWQS